MRARIVQIRQTGTMRKELKVSSYVLRIASFTLTTVTTNTDKRISDKLCKKSNT